MSLDDIPRHEQARVLLHAVLTPHGFEAAEHKLMLALNHPQFGPVITRVHARRLSYLEHLGQYAGLSAERAAAKARIAYACYLGYLQLHSSGLVPADSERDRMVEELVAIMGQLAT